MFKNQISFDMYMATIPAPASEVPAHPPVSAPRAPQPEATPAEKIQDFGEVIEGAKKMRTFLEQFEDMTLPEKCKVKKTKVLQKVDTEGLNRYQKAFLEVGYKAIPNTPALVNSKQSYNIRRKDGQMVPFADVKEDWIRAYVTIITEFYAKLQEKALKIPDYGFKFCCDAMKEDMILTSQTKTYYSSVLSKSYQKTIRHLAQEVMDYIYAEDLYDTDEEAASNLYCLESEATTTVESKDDYRGNPILEATVSRPGCKTFYSYPVDNIKAQVLLQQEQGEHIGFPRNRNSILPIFRAETKEELVAKILLAKNLEAKAKESQTSTTPAKKTTRKGNFSMPHLDGMGFSPLFPAKPIKGEEILETFSLRGGQFGNWVSKETEKQAFLDYTYDAFLVLAEVLGCDHHQIGLHQPGVKALGIAFGARGNSSAVAHYEPVERVINITRKKGAGSLAHEWAHALDDALNRPTDNAIPFEETSWGYRRGCSELFGLFMTGIRQNCPQFLDDAKELDKSYGKSGHHSYWATNTELFARAFAFYVDSLSKEQGNYSPVLTGHAVLDSQCSYTDSFGNQVKAYIYPHAKSEVDYVMKAFPVFLEKALADIEAR